jgi:superfamily II DNA/RNA helicase
MQPTLTLTYTSVEMQEFGQNLSDNLKAMGIKDFYPVQMEVIPILLRQNALRCVIPRDICI